MSSDGEDPVLGNEPVESRYEMNKRSRISYSREFLLSLSELDICKKLPSGFDVSILSEFEDSSHEQRVSGTFLLHGFRRGDYGSSPPTGGDSGNYSRGMHGRWDGRSSGRSDKDSDSQSDWDSDSGRRYVSQSRRVWQAPEHDGLLGSGSFPRPSSYTPGASAYSLNRSTEPYHPPRPYKFPCIGLDSRFDIYADAASSSDTFQAAPHPRSHANDSFNDETFGSSEFTTEDRAEEERKRRASFELLRKEQQKAFQERQNIGLPKDDFDITTLMEDPIDVTHLNNQSESEKPKAPQSLSTDSLKSSVPIQIPGARPLVPPGFAGTMLEKSVEAKGLMPDYSSSPAANDLPLSGSVFNSKEKQADCQMSLISTHDISENSVAEGSHDNLQATLVKSNQLVKKQAEGSAVAESIWLDPDIRADDKVVGQSGHSNSILEKLFGNALTLDENPMTLNFKPKNVMDDALSPHAVHSSKFVHLFPEGKGSTESNNFLSLVFGEENAAKSEQSWPNSLFTASHPANEQIKLDAFSKAIGSPEGLRSRDKMLAVPPVLTCEDLENSILSEFSEGGTKIQQPDGVLEISDDMTKPRKNDIDDHASQHLLSLLQKAGHEDKPLSSNLGSKLSDQSQNCHADNFNGLQSHSEAAIGKNLDDGGQTSTLEALFGSAFMKALQSDGAPVSAQGAGSARLDLVDPHESSLPMDDKKLMPPLGHDTLSSKNIAENDISSLNRKRQSSLNMEEQFVIDDILIEADKPQFQSEVAPGASIVGQPEKVRLPEDDSLVTSGDLFNLHGNSARSSIKAEFPSYSSPFDIGGPCTALDSLFKDGNYVMEQAVPPFQVRFERRDSDISFPNVQNPHSSHLQPNLFNHMGPVYNPQDSYTILNNPLMKQRDSMLHIGTPPNHQIPHSMLRPIHHPGAGFDTRMLHPMMQQMHPPGSFPLSHQLQGTSSGPRHPNQQVSGLMQELNLVPGFQFGHRQPSFGGMPPPAPEVGVANNHPEALQRLLEMELRLNNKPVNPFPAAAAGNGQGLYGHDLDLSFRYR